MMMGFSYAAPGAQKLSRQPVSTGREVDQGQEIGCVTLRIAFSHQTFQIIDTGLYL